MSDSSQSLKQRVWQFYATKWGVLLAVTFGLLLLSIGFLFLHSTSGGGVINRDVSLKGGVSFTIPLANEPDLDALGDGLGERFPEYELALRGVSTAGFPHGVIVQADLDINDDQAVDDFTAALGEELGVNLDEVEYGVEFFGSSLGESFFRESVLILGIAFAFMALVIFIYFRKWLPSVSIVLAAFSDMVIALAFVNLFDITLGTAGIAAFLMLIGYAVDTNILLSIRVLKRREGTLDERIASSLKTGLTQTFTSLIAISIAFILTPSEVVREIMLILLVGLSADLVFTWIQNVGLLRWYFRTQEVTRR